jgi:hypothetical protein
MAEMKNGFLPILEIEGKAKPRILAHKMVLNLVESACDGDLPVDRIANETR